MTDPGREQELEELLARVRALRPPIGARERVLERTELALGARRAMPHAIALAGLAFALAVAGVALWLVPSGQPPMARVLAASNARGAGGALRAGDGVAEDAIVVGAHGRLRIALRAAQVGLLGPARIELADDALIMHEGEALVDGTLPVRGGECRALLHGRCSLARTTSVLQITLFAGSVELTANPSACSVIDLSTRSMQSAAPKAPVRAPATAAPAQPEAREPARVAAKTERPARARPEPPSELALQVAAYREALALRGSNDARAIELWREMNRRWPQSPLRHEIDLNVIDALVRLGRSDEARVEARRFLERHPHSSKAPALRHMLGDEVRAQ